MSTKYFIDHDGESLPVEVWQSRVAGYIGQGIGLLEGITVLQSLPPSPETIAALTELGGKYSIVLTQANRAQCALSTLVKRG